MGNITTWTQQHEAVSRAYDFAYDPVDQLVGATYRTTDAVPSVLARYGYAYDTVGNRTMLKDARTRVREQNGATPVAERVT